MPTLTPTQTANVREALARWHGYGSLEAIRPALEAAAAGAPVKWPKAALAALDVPQLHPSCLSFAIDLACIERVPRYRRNLASVLRARVLRYHAAAT